VSNGRLAARLSPTRVSRRSRRAARAARATWIGPRDDNPFRAAGSMIAISPPGLDVGADAPLSRRPDCTLPASPAERDRPDPASPSRVD